MKPDWSSKNVPTWAMYAAQEASGSWYWYSDRPTYSEICTEWQTRGQRQIIPKVELRPQETLESRPSDGCQCKFGNVLNFVAYEAVEIPYDPHWRAPG